MNVHRELRSLIQRKDNRQCADCAVALTDLTAVFCSMRFGSFLCVECASVHRSFGTHVTRVKSVVHDNWTAEDIAQVDGGNRLCNTVYEHCVPRSWAHLKPVPGAERDEREHWIASKYISRLFLLPNVALDPSDRTRGRADPLKLPIRLIDAFVTVGAQELAPHSGSLADASPEDVRLVPRVLDCFPRAEAEPSRSPPEHLAQFVFPGACTLLSRERPPTAFSFVLTGVTSVKQHGVALTIWEETEASTLAPLFRRLPEAARPSWVRSLSSDDGAFVKLVFAPKVLVLLSHYPFYSAMQEYLTQLYRISLSSAPLPIERYISSFVSEAPLPPQGQVEVHYPLPDRTIVLLRPPKNRLPMADFSYRPLFACLSLQHVLDVFGCLLIEARVAIFSRYLSILTPVCEALLSLLFPFDWQGAFIPIIPDAMTDMLDAPVPFLLGAHRKYIDATPKDRWPEGVVIVDLDRDELHLGTDEDTGLPRASPELPSKEARKLKEALREHASQSHGAIDRDRRQQLALREARRSRLSSTGSIVAGSVDDVDEVEDDYQGPDAAFPEHGIMPIVNWAHEQGMSYNTAQRGGGGARRRRSLVDGFGFGEGRHLLDARANEARLDEGGDGFSAQGIRAAFLRFFVSAFREYVRFVRAPASGGGDARLERLFDREGFVALSTHLNPDCHGFMHGLLQSQLFERFLEERLSDPDRPEIRFFDESILQKRNRSVATRSKHATPFLDDASDEVRETFHCQPPSHWGLEAHQEYTYASFPRLQDENVGDVRKPRRLFKEPEQLRRKGFRTRAGDSEAQQTFEQLVQRGLQRMAPRRFAAPPSSRAGPQPPAPEAAAPPGPSVDVLLRAVVALQSRARMRLAQGRVRALHRAASTIQAHVRAARAGKRARVDWDEMQRVVLRLQAFLRARLARNAVRRRRAALLAAQAFARGAAARIRFLRLRAAATRLQAAERMRQARRSYAEVVRLIVVIQATFRGHKERSRSLRRRRALLATMRGLLYSLWVRAHTPLKDRSKFWLLFQGHSMLDLALHHQELERVAMLLGALNGGRERSPHFSYERQFDQIRRFLGAAAAEDGGAASKDGACAVAALEDGAAGAGGRGAAGGARRARAACRGTWRWPRRTRRSSGRTSTTG